MGIAKLPFYIAMEVVVCVPSVTKLPKALTGSVQEMGMAI